MPVIINEVEVIAPPPRRDDQDINAQTIKPPGPTPGDIYWVTRRLLERRLRLQAR